MTDFHRDERRLCEPYKAFQDHSPRHAPEKTPPPKPFWTARKVIALTPLAFAAAAVVFALVCVK